MDRRTWRVGNGGGADGESGPVGVHNRYFMVRPTVVGDGDVVPPVDGGGSVEEELGVAGLLESPFWTNTGVR